jgi:catechol 2,3-dioxygenase-like lactoylglutathione lyase family enzyme
VRSWRVLDIGFIGIVSDADAARDFYSDVLGLEVLDTADDYLYLSAGPQARVEILRSSSESARAQRADAPSIGFLVDDLDAAREALSPTGLLSGEEREWHSETEAHRWCYLRDPAGNVLLLLERRSS